MAFRCQCSNCGKTTRYYEDEIQEAGTQWAPVLRVTCPGCRHQTDTPGRTSVAMWLTPGIHIMGVDSKPDLAERLHHSDVLELVVQDYVQKNPSKYGMEDMGRPRRRGPDFIARTANGRTVKVEVELNWQRYLTHGHDNNPSFKDVMILILFSPDDPPTERRGRLPSVILHIDQDDFYKWAKSTYPWSVDDEQNRQVSDLFRRVVYLVAGEFNRRFVTSCLFHEREGAMGGDCDTCVYFPLGLGEADSFFLKQTIVFLKGRGMPAGWTSEYLAQYLTGITTSEIDECMSTVIKPKLMVDFEQKDNDPE